MANTLFVPPARLRSSRLDPRRPGDILLGRGSDVMYQRRDNFYDTAIGHNNTAYRFGDSGTNQYINWQESGWQPASYADTNFGLIAVVRSNTVDASRNAICNAGGTNWNYWLEQHSDNDFNFAIANMTGVHFTSELSEANEWRVVCCERDRDNALLRITVDGKTPVTSARGSVTYVVNDRFRIGRHPGLDDFGWRGEIAAVAFFDGEKPISVEGAHTLLRGVDLSALHSPGAWTDLIGLTPTRLAALPPTTRVSKASHFYNERTGDGSVGAVTSTNIEDTPHPGFGPSRLDGLQYNYGGLTSTFQRATSAEANAVGLPNGSTDIAIMAAWICDEDTGSNQAIIGKYGNAAERSWTHNIETGSLAIKSFASHDGTTILGPSTSGNVTLGQLHTSGMRTDMGSTQMHSYLDGGSKGTLTDANLTTLFDTPVALNIGARKDGTIPFSGKIFVVLAYSGTTITDADFATFHGAITKAAAAGIKLTHQYLLDEGVPAGAVLVNIPEANDLYGDKTVGGDGLAMSAPSSEDDWPLPVYDKLTAQSLGSGAVIKQRPGPGEWKLGGDVGSDIEIIKPGGKMLVDFPGNATTVDDTYARTNGGLAVPAAGRSRIWYHRHGVCPISHNGSAIDGFQISNDDDDGWQTTNFAVQFRDREIALNNSSAQIALGSDYIGSTDETSYTDGDEDIKCWAVETSLGWMAILKKSTSEEYNFCGLGLHNELNATRYHKLFNHYGAAEIFESRITRNVNYIPKPVASWRFDQSDVNPLSSYTTDKEGLFGERTLNRLDCNLRTGHEFQVIGNALAWDRDAGAVNPIGEYCAADIGKDNQIVFHMRISRDNLGAPGVGLIFRQSSAANDVATGAWMLIIDTTDEDVRLFEDTGGGFTGVANMGISTSADVEYDVQAHVVNNRLSAWCWRVDNGNSQGYLSHNLGATTAGTYAGPFFNAGSVGISYLHHLVCYDWDLAGQPPPLV